MMAADGLDWIGLDWIGLDWIGGQTFRGGITTTAILWFLAYHVGLGDLTTIRKNREVCFRR
jgi:hypothetical protein